MARDFINERAAYSPGGKIQTVRIVPLFRDSLRGQPGARSAQLAARAALRGTRNAGTGYELRAASHGPREGSGRETLNSIDL
jgi:hypothetical protein